MERPIYARSRNQPKTVDERNKPVHSLSASEYPLNGNFALGSFGKWKWYHMGARQMQECAALSVVLDKIILNHR